MRTNLESKIQNPPASIIIPNWNGARWLRGCLEATRRQTYQPREVLVVDGASRDESTAIVEREFPEVALLRLPENRGFCGNVNAGLRQARGEVLALLNNDAEPEPEWLAELVRGLLAHPEAGMCAAKMVLFDRPGVINSAGDFFSLDGLPGNRGVWEKDSGQYDGEEFVFSACGGAAAYRRAMLDDVGLLDERFFAYCEDVDLSFRAQLRGWRCLYVPTARVRHRLSATGGGPLASYYCGRNVLWVIARNVPASLLRRLWPRMALAQVRLVVESLRHVREPAARARLRGQLAGLRSLPSLLAGRREIQRRRTVADEYLLALLSAAPSRRTP
ncbi:MAG: glycosyltransferase family 2 protein [Chloroflexi bacterium]|nr:glycosyltransferase family 2 protein [Chloroflexota bacterium]